MFPVHGISRGVEASVVVDERDRGSFGCLCGCPCDDCLVQLLDSGIGVESVDGNQERDQDLHRRLRLPHLIYQRAVSLNDVPDCFLLNNIIGPQMHHNDIWFRGAQPTRKVTLSYEVDSQRPGVTLVVAIIRKATVGRLVGSYKVCVGSSCGLEFLVKEGAPAALGLLALILGVGKGLRR